MAHESQGAGFAIPGLAASNINAGAAVSLVGAVVPGSAQDEKYYTATSSKPVAGVARATALGGKPVDVQLLGVVKMRAAASIGAGAPVGPVSGVATDAIGLTPSGGAQAGMLLTNAAAGDIVPVLLRQQLFIL
jgi:hypothetical protein